MTSPKVLAIIQARMNSTRLPSKALLDLMGKSVLEHIIERVRAAKSVSEVVVATTDTVHDDVLEAALKKMGFAVFRGSENDVLDRFYQCALPYKPELIVRVTADDPLKDPEIIDRAVGLLLADPHLDYCSNTIKPTFPEGLDIEAFRFSVLEKAHHEAKLPSEREHVTPYIWKNPGTFKTLNFEHDEDLSSWRWTMDKLDDFEFIQAIYRKFYSGKSYFPYRAVIEHIKAHPELREINSGTVRNEGYLKSLQKEQT